MHQTEKLELYKLFVDSASNVTEARSRTNSFFITINAAIIGSSGFIEIDALIIFGILINFLWIGAIESYRCLNEAKFAVIHKIENDLIYQCFQQEERICSKQRRTAFTKIEKNIPAYLNLLFVAWLFHRHWDKLIDWICELCSFLCQSI